MSEQMPSLWARPGPGDVRPEIVVNGSADASGMGRRHHADGWPAPEVSPVGTALRDRADDIGGHDGSFGTGAVTSSDRVPAVWAPSPLDDAAQRRRTMRWFAGGAATIFAVGLVVILALILTGHSPLIGSNTSAPPDTRAPLAKLCPPPSGPAAPSSVTPPTPAGPRTVDARSGISYQAFGSPWRPWSGHWNNAGDLRVAYDTGQFFVTEVYPGGDYLATILSASVPAATNDALTLDLKCTGHQVAADVRTAYYPQPNQMETIKDEQTTLGGRPAWLSEFRLHFHAPGLKATDELVAIALIDVGRPSAAILYISIPGTHRQYDYVVDEVLASVRPTS